MSKSSNIGLSNIAKKTKTLMIGGGNLSKKSSKAYIGVNNTAKEFSEDEEDPAYKYIIGAGSVTATSGYDTIFSNNMNEFYQTSATSSTFYSGSYICSAFVYNNTWYYIGGNASIYKIENSQSILVCKPASGSGHYCGMQNGFVLFAKATVSSRKITVTMSTINIITGVQNAAVSTTYTYYGSSSIAVRDINGFYATSTANRYGICVIYDEYDDDDDNTGIINEVIFTMNSNGALSSLSFNQLFRLSYGYVGMVVFYDSNVLFIDSDTYSGSSDHTVYDVRNNRRTVPLYAYRGTLRNKTNYILYDYRTSYTYYYDRPYNGTTWTKRAFGTRPVNGYFNYDGQYYWYLASNGSRLYRYTNMSSSATLIKTFGSLPYPGIRLNTTDGWYMNT